MSNVIGSDCSVNALTLQNTRDITVTDSFFSGTNAQTIYTGTNVNGFTLTQSTVQGAIAGGWLMELTAATSNMTFTQNTFNATNTGTRIIDADVSLTNGFFSNNQFIISNSAYTTAAIEGTFIICTFTGNIWSGYNGGGTGALYFTSSSSANLVEDNIFPTLDFPAIHDVSSFHDRLINNVGYNPVKAIASSFDNTNHIIEDAGGSSTPTNATTYTVWESSKTITVTVTALFPTHELTIIYDGTTITPANFVPQIGIAWSQTLTDGETFLIDDPSTGVTVTVSGT
jgi:hypothetical protein